MATVISEHAQGVYVALLTAFGALLVVAIPLHLRSDGTRPPVVLTALGVTAAIGAVTSVVALAVGSSVAGFVVLVIAGLGTAASLLAIFLRGLAIGKGRGRVAGAALVGLAVSATFVGARFAGDERDPALADLQPKPYYVQGTCANGACGLNRRVAPSPDAQVSGSRLKDGDRVLVLCQQDGETYRARGGHSSNQWDLLKGDTWVSDMFISSSKDGRTSVDLPRCPAGESG